MIYYANISINSYIQYINNKKYAPPKEKKQLYFNFVLIYTDNKVKFQ